MSTIKATHIQHPSAASPNLTLASDGTVSGGAGLGGLVHIHTESFSGVSSVSLDNVFTADYENYKMIVRVNAVASATLLNMRFRSGGVDATGTNYNSQELQVNATTLNGTRTNNTTQQVIMNLRTDLMGQQRFVELYQPALPLGSNYFITGYDPYAGGLLKITNGTYSTAASQDGLTLYPSVGTVDGTVSVYGYANS
jgi:hypothetical protein